MPILGAKQDISTSTRMSFGLSLVFGRDSIFTSSRGIISRRYMKALRIRIQRRSILLAAIKMLLRRYITYPLIILLLILVIGTGLFLATDALLPGLLETWIISILKKDAGISEITLNMRELDLDGADLGARSVLSRIYPDLLQTPRQNVPRR